MNTYEAINVTEEFRMFSQSVLFTYITTTVVILILWYCLYRLLYYNHIHNQVKGHNNFHDMILHEWAVKKD